MCEIWAIAAVIMQKNPVGCDHYGCTPLQRSPSQLSTQTVTHRKKCLADVAFCVLIDMYCSCRETCCLIRSDKDVTIFLKTIFFPLTLNIVCEKVQELRSAQESRVKNTVILNLDTRWSYVASRAGRFTPRKCNTLLTEMESTWNPEPMWKLSGK
jgi:hypothetical protein